jgi:hypothetical protein
MNKPKPITKAKILLVEGQDEVHLFTELLAHIGLGNDIEVFEVKGKTCFPDRIKDLKDVSGFDKVISIGIIRDADNDPPAAFQSLIDALNKAKLPEPTVPLQPKAGPPSVNIMIVPDIDTKGMIENVCLNSVSDDPAMVCVDQYFECLQGQKRTLDENVIPKARVHAFLASRELLEIAHFEYLQKCMNNYEPVVPISPATAVSKVHTFLASRYTPDLRLGEAAGKSGQKDSYWQFDHPAFEKIKHFLQML